MRAIGISSTPLPIAAALEHKIGGKLPNTTDFSPDDVAQDGGINSKKKSMTTSLSPEDITPDDIIIAFMGPSGTGKSTFIDLLTNREEKRGGDSLESVTREVEAVCIPHPQSGNRIVLVDTPGFNDTTLTELEVLELIANWLETTYRRSVKLFGIVYLHSIADRRMKGSTLNNLKMFERLCGEFAMRSVVFTTTMWEDTNLSDAINREIELILKFWQPMIEMEATVNRLQVMEPSEAWRVIDALIKKRRRLPREVVMLQRELVDHGLKLLDTKVGKELQKSSEERQPKDLHAKVVGIPTADDKPKAKDVTITFDDRNSSPNDSTHKDSPRQNRPQVLSPEDIIPEDIVIAFMGPTKSGKTMLVDLLTGRKEQRAGHGLESVTRDVEATYALHPKSGDRIVFVDTPSFNDIYLTELEVLERIANWLQSTYKRNIKLFAIVYFQSIADHHKKPSTIRYLQMFEHLCGEFAMARVVFMTTMWEKVKVNDGIAKEVQLVSKFWKPMIALGAVVDRLQVNNYDQVWRVVDDIIESSGGSSREALSLQVELVDLKRNLGETTAGQGLSASLKEVVTRDEKRLQTLLAEKKKLGDSKSVEKLDAELGAIEANIEQMNADLARLRISLSRQMQLYFGATSRKYATLCYLAAATTKDVLDYIVAEAARPEKRVSHGDIQLFVNFLDMTLDNEYLKNSDQRNRILTALSRTAIDTGIYPQRSILKSIEYDRRVAVKGEFGDIHKALGGTVCVKVMKEIDNEMIKSYVQEIVLSLRLSHPNILPCLGIFTPLSGTGMCLVSPWMKNGDLYNYTAGCPQAGRMPLLLDVADALVHVHRLGVVHNNIKGRNVLVSEEGRALLADFRLSHVATSTMNHQQATTEATFWTSVNFAAPEMLIRMVEGISRVPPDSTCDTWSFGGLCYEILTRKEPFRGFGVARIYDHVCNDRGLPRRPGVNQEDDEDDDQEAIGDEMWALMNACWKFDPQQRPDSRKVREMTARLINFDNRPAPKPVGTPRGVKIVSEPYINPDLVQRVLRGIKASIKISES